MSDLYQRPGTLDEAEAESLRQAHERGDLTHLYGKPLDLSDDPEWMVAKVVKTAGFTHPALERARELDAPRQAAETVINRLRRRRAWLADPASGCTVAQATEFNEWRLQALADYREKLVDLNRAIRDFNLGVPDALHERPMPLEATLTTTAQALPPLRVPVEPSPPRFWRAIPFWHHRTKGREDTR